MKFALSTNWCSLDMESGEAIVDKALELGFEALELGFHITEKQAQGIERRLGEMPVGSVHAFCPVPLSAPQGYPELYQLANFSEDGRAIARLNLKKNIEFAAKMGAKTVVLHAGRVLASGFFGSPMKRRVRRGQKMVEVFKRELDGIVSELEKHGVTLGLENLPYLEGFPAEWEIAQVVGDWVKPWFDTGHDFVRRHRGWVKSELPGPDAGIIGMHINDSVGGDDHLPPGAGRVDFAALRPLAQSVRHLVFEPHSNVSELSLKSGMELLRALWT